jgi:hypothetical protein
MDRWSLVRERIELYLGQRNSAKDRAYRLRRETLADELGVNDVTLKGFLPVQDSKSGKAKSGTLGFDKLRKLLAKQEFQDLRNEFPEVGIAVSQPPTFREIQLELDFQGFDVSPQTRIVRLPIGREGRLRLTIRRAG